ncbi:uncharacterized protein LOC118432684 [Branchiostoma floridae]|uniref:Uncharacterized protein LOC118432684 n=1 Tax=Branchiostoma floridae TaxID=7739 RepID=A0A9J7NDU8_BRAFL|nr:uncharacterized protein LOC118432684 [Branchiostoma floridae]
MAPRDWCVSVLSLMLIMNAFGHRCVAPFHAGQLIRVGKSGEWKRPARRPPFRTYDVDLDGKVSSDEWHRVEEMLSGWPAAEIFSLLDRNEDGWLTKPEFNTGKQRLGAKDWNFARPTSGISKRLIGV